MNIIINSDIIFTIDLLFLLYKNIKYKKLDK